MKENPPRKAPGRLGATSIAARWIAVPRGVDGRGASTAVVISASAMPTVSASRTSAMTAQLRQAASKPDIREPGFLRREAWAEEARAVAEVADSGRVIDREPVDAL